MVGIFAIGRFSHSRKYFTQVIQAQTGGRTHQSDEGKLRLGRKDC